MWADILVRLKQAQKDHRMNIRKQELTELGIDTHTPELLDHTHLLPLRTVPYLSLVVNQQLRATPPACRGTVCVCVCVCVLLSSVDVYHRILRFQNYLVAMINKNVLPYKVHIPFYGEK